MTHRPAPPAAGPAASAHPVVPALPWLLLAGVLLFALNLRGPLVAVAPLAGLLQRELSVSAGTVGLLTSLPVLCFGLASPLASLVIARAGVHRAVLVSLAGVLAGTVLRSVGGAGTAVAGTVLIGVAITVGNVVVPVLIARDFPRATGMVTAAYTATLNVGSTLTSTLTAPLAAALGWRAALAAWGVLVLLAAVVWVRAAGRRGHGPGSRGGPPGGAGGARVPDHGARSTLRRPVVWGLTLAFAGQAFGYYGTTAWLPSLLADEQGLSAAEAGASSALFQIFAVAGAFAVPVLTRVLRRLWLVLLVVCAAWACLPLGLLLAPAGWPVWCSVAGAAQGGGITVLFLAVVVQARDAAENRRMSALVQTGGYTVAATGPALVGAAHEVSGGWDLPLLVVLSAVCVMAVAGALSAGRRTAPLPHGAPPAG
ncbi:MFS transporter [Kineococcus sp. NUM-3379]